MNNIKSLRNFGTIYLWIFALKVLQVACGDVEYRTDTDTDTDTAANFNPDLLLKAYAYQIFDDDDNTDDYLLNEQHNAVAAPLWQKLNKHQPLQLYFSQPLWPSTIPKTAKAKHGNAMNAREITFENLNNFDGFKTKTAIWPKLNKHNQYDVKFNDNGDINDIKQQRHSLQQYFIVPSSLEKVSGVGAQEGDKQKTSWLNIRYKQNGLLPIPIRMEKHFKTQATTTKAIKKSNTLFTDANAAGVSEGAAIKENVFPLKDGNTFNVNNFDVDVGDVGNVDGAATGGGAVLSYENESAAFADEENGIANNNGNGNESFNYADNNEANSNYLMAHVSDNNRYRGSHLAMNRQTKRIMAKPMDKRAKPPSFGQTPFLPAVSGGAMTNLGKFFRDLSKNVHVNEQFQWNADEQKLLEGDPNFASIQHHLTKPDAATDQQTAEWIKAIRFYRPSQKIRSLVAMNPHGQWAHSSQFIDPNYMWVGLGK